MSKENIPFEWWACFGIAVASLTLGESTIAGPYIAATFVIIYIWREGKR